MWNALEEGGERATWRGNEQQDLFNHYKAKPVELTGLEPALSYK